MYPVYGCFLLLSLIFSFDVHAQAVGPSLGSSAGPSPSSNQLAGISGHASAVPSSTGTISQSTSSQPPNELKTAQLASAVATAEKHQARCENVHAGARTLTSAALFPVRFIGKSPIIMLCQHTL